MSPNELVLMIRMLRIIVATEDTESTEIYHSNYSFSFLVFARSLCPLWRSDDDAMAAQKLQRNAFDPIDEH